MIPVYITADITSLGRPDKDSLPQQTLMELLVENIDARDVFQESDGYYKNIADWSGMRIIESGDVHSIDWEPGGGFFDNEDEATKRRDLTRGGSIDLQWTPSTVKCLILSQLGLSETIETTDLPRGLNSLYINGNSFVGTFDVKSLPHSIHNVSLSLNELSGSLNIDGMPPASRSFHAFKNKFSGSVGLSSLPSNMTYLDLANNRFSGTVDLRSLPESLRLLCLDRNCIEQEELVVSHILPHMKELTIDSEKFQRVTDTRGIPVSFTLDLRGKRMRLDCKSSAHQETK